jgi:repressor LexA
LLGCVASGRPIEAVATPDTLEIPSWMVRGGETFVLRVKGDSIVGDGILEGDYLVVRREPEPSTGQTIVALLNGGATVKRFRRSGQTVELHPSNPVMEPIVIKEGQALEIRGVVVGVIRRCE